MYVSYAKKTSTRKRENMPETDDMDIFVVGTGRRDKVGDELAGVVAHVEGIVGGLSTQNGQPKRNCKRKEITLLRDPLIIPTVISKIGKYISTIELIGIVPGSSCPTSLAVPSRRRGH